MKHVKIVPIFLVVILAFNSCEEAQNRYLYNEKISTELERYSDVLDLTHTQINLTGRGFYWLPGSLPAIELSLYLKPGCNNWETLVKMRDKISTFFSDNNWEVVEVINLRGSITANFIVEKDGETKIVYEVGAFVGEWYERCGSNLPGEISFFMREPICDEEFNAMLGNYTDTINFKRSGVFYSDTGFICINVYITVEDYLREPLVHAILNDINDFFIDNCKKRIKTYGSSDGIRIDFFNVDGDAETEYIGCFTYEFNEQDGRWRSYHWR